MRTKWAMGLGALGFAALALVVEWPGEQPVEAPANLASVRHATVAVPFVENVGQAPPTVRFTARTFAGAVHVTDAGQLVYSLPSSTGESALLRESLVSTSGARVAPGDRSATRFSVFRGSDPDGWHGDIPTYASVDVAETETGVGLEVRASARNVEKLFLVPAGVDPEGVRMHVEGAQSLAVGPGGELEVSTAAGVLRFTEPEAFQIEGGLRTEVEVAYVVQGDDYGFAVGAHDPDLPMTIDPLIAATYLGADDYDWGTDLEVDWETRAIFVTGWTQSDGFPTTPGAYDEGEPPPAAKGHSDAFVARFSNDLTTLEACTLLGGGDLDKSYGISISGRGVWVAGETGSSDFPTTVDCIQPTHGGGTLDGWVAKFNHDLTVLDAATYHGGNGRDAVKDVVAAGGGLYLAGETRSTDLWFPDRAMQKVLDGSIDLFFATLNENLTTLSFQSLLGGSSSESVSRITAAEGTITAVGDTFSTDFPTTSGAVSNAKSGEIDGFVTVMLDDYSELIASTYLGGVAEMSELESATDVWEDGSSIYVAGYTNAIGFPTTPGAYDTTFNDDHNVEAFVCKLDWDCKNLLASTFLGGSGSDEARGLAVDQNGVYVVGNTSSDDFPANVIDTTPNGSRDGFAAALSRDLSTLSAGATYLGGTQSDSCEEVVVVDGVLYVVGYSWGPGFPTTPGVYDETHNGVPPRTDAIVTSLTLTGAPEPPPEIDSYFLPKKINVKHKTRVERSLLKAAGFLDTGSGEVDFKGPATLTVGDQKFQFTGIFTNLRGVYRYKDFGVDFKIRPHKTGSSRAKFQLRIKDAIVAQMPRDGPIELRFQTTGIDGRGTVKMTDGKYKLGQFRGDLIAPHLCLYNCRAKIKGGVKDKFHVKLGLAGGEGVPAQAPAVMFRIGDTFEESLPSDVFVPGNGRYIFRGPKGALSKVKLDYLKEKLVVKAVAIDAGAYPDGPQPVRIGVKLGDGPEYVVWVRMVRKKKSLRY